MNLKAFTLRLPISLYHKIKQKKKASISAYVVEAVQEKLARDEQEELRRGFATLDGEIDEETAAWIEAQREAMKRVDD